MTLEKKLLKFSAFGGLFFAVLGLAWGIIIKSNMIMFDGLYASISLFLSMFAIWITNYIEKSDLENFPFGKVMFEPITVAVKSIILILMCTISFKDAVKEILNGGNIINTDLALGYSIISTIACTLIYKLISKKSTKLSSEILKAESSQWFMDSILSAGVLVGYFITMILGATRFSYYTRFVDPLMVVLISVVFIRVPLMTLFKSFNEMVNGKADDEINEEINTIVEDIKEEYNFQDSITRVSKIGRELRIEIDFVFNEKSTLTELEEMDKVREQVYANMIDIKLKKWLNINFTGDKKWAI